MTAWIDRVATRRVIAALFALDIALFASVNLLSFPLSVPHMKALTGSTYLDMCAFCSADDVMNRLAAFGDAGRSQQLRLALSLDIAIPLVTGAFGVLAIVRLLPRYRRWAIIAPLAATALDFTENAVIVALVRRYPDVSPGLAAAEGSISGAKLVAYAATFIVIVFAALLAATARARARRARPSGGR